MASERNDLIERLEEATLQWLELRDEENAALAQEASDTIAAQAAEISRLEAEAEAGKQAGINECLEHIAYVRANIIMNPKDRLRFSRHDLNTAFKSALDVVKERITGEDEGKWKPEEEPAPPRTEGERA